MTTDFADAASASAALLSCRTVDDHWRRFEQELDALHVPLPLASRAAWAEHMPGAANWLFGARTADGRAGAAFALARHRSNALPGHVIARVDRAGSSILSEAGQTVVSAICDAVREDSRVLELQVELVLRTPEQHALAATQLRALGFERRPAPRHYRDTLVVDLSPSLDAVFASFSTKTRRDIRQGEKQPVEVRPIDDVRFASRLAALNEETMSRTGGVATPAPWAERITLSNAIPDHSRLVGLFRAGENDPESLLAFAWGGCHGDFAHYDSAGSTRATDLKVALNYPLLWDLIQWSHRRGAAWFDLGGVTLGTHDSADPLGGISDFKRWFSKELAAIGEDWVLYPHPGRSAIASGLRRAHRLLGRRA